MDPLQHQGCETSPSILSSRSGGLLVLINGPYGLRRKEMSNSTLRLLYRGTPWLLFALVGMAVGSGCDSDPNSIKVLSWPIAILGLLSSIVTLIRAIRQFWTKPKA